MKRFLSMLATGALALGLYTTASAQTRGIGAGALTLDDLQNAVPPHLVTLEAPLVGSPEWLQWQSEGFPNLTWSVPVPPTNNAQSGFVYSGPLNQTTPASVPFSPYNLLYWLGPGQTGFNNNGGAAGAWDWANTNQLGIITNSCTGIVGRIPIWTAASTLCNSSLSDNGTTVSTPENLSLTPTGNLTVAAGTSQLMGNVGIGQVPGVDQLDVTGNSVINGTGGGFTTIGNTATGGNVTLNAPGGNTGVIALNGTTNINTSAYAQTTIGDGSPNNQLIIHGMNDAVSGSPYYPGSPLWDLDVQGDASVTGILHIGNNLASIWIDGTSLTNTMNSDRPLALNSNFGPVSLNDASSSNDGTNINSTSGTGAINIGNTASSALTLNSAATAINTTGSGTTDIGSTTSGGAVSISSSGANPITVNVGDTTNNLVLDNIAYNNSTTSFLSLDGSGNVRQHDLQDLVKGENGVLVTDTAGSAIAELGASNTDVPFGSDRFLNTNASTLHITNGLPGVNFVTFNGATATTTITGNTNINTAGAAVTNIGTSGTVTNITGATNINTTGNATTDIGTSGTGIVNLGNTTGNTAVTGNIYPSTNHLYDVGTTANRWANVNTDTLTFDNLFYMTSPSQNDLSLSSIDNSFNLHLNTDASGTGAFNVYLDNLANPAMNVQTSGTTIASDNGGATPNQLTLEGQTSITQQLILGYNTTGNWGSVQSILQGTGAEPLYLQPYTNGLDNPHVGVDYAGGSTLPYNLSVNGTMGSTGNAAVGGGLLVSGAETFAGDIQSVSMRATGVGSSWTGAGVFGGTGNTNNAVIAGEIGGKAEIGGHLGDLSAWENLYVNAGGGDVQIGSDASAPTHTLEVVGTMAVSGLASTNGGLTNTGAFTTAGGAASINDNSNFATTINTGSSTGSTTIGSTANGGGVTIASSGTNPITLDVGNTGNTLVLNHILGATDLSFLTLGAGNAVHTRTMSGLADNGVYWNSTSNTFQLGGLANTDVPFAANRFVNINASNLDFTSNGGANTAMLIGGGASPYVSINTTSTFAPLTVQPTGGGDVLLGGGATTGSEIKFLGTRHMSIYNNGTALSFANTSTFAQTNTAGSVAMSLDDASGLLTTNFGISNTGDISTGTLHTTGLATLNSASVTTTLGVGGLSTTNGISNTGAITQSGASSPITLTGSTATSGYLMTATGTTSTPSWTNPTSIVVTSFQTSLAGLTPSSATTGAVTLAGTLGATSGGTGSSTAPSDGQILVGSTAGANYAPATLGTTTGISITTGSHTLTINNTGVLSVGASGVLASTGGQNPVLSLTGVVPIANGGTNSGTALSGSSIMISNGTQIVQGAAGTATTVLHGNAAGAPTYSGVANADLVGGVYSAITGLGTQTQALNMGSNGITSAGNVSGVGTMAGTFAGVATITGTATQPTYNFAIANTSVTANSTIILTTQQASVAGDYFTPYVASITGGTGFTVHLSASPANGESVKVHYIIVN